MQNINSDDLPQNNDSTTLIFLTWLVTRSTMRVAASDFENVYSLLLPMTVNVCVQFVMANDCECLCTVRCGW